MFQCTLVFSLADYILEHKDDLLKMKKLPKLRYLLKVSNKASQGLLKVVQSENIWHGFCVPNDNLKQVSQITLPCLLPTLSIICKQNNRLWKDRRVVHGVTTSGNAWQQMTTSDNEWPASGTTSDNEWCNEWQQMVTSDNEWQRVTTIDKEWQRVVQRMRLNDSEWQSRLIFLFFQIREEPATKHPNENSLNLEKDLRRRPIELRAKTTTQEEILTIRTRNKLD